MIATHRWHERPYCDLGPAARAQAVAAGNGECLALTCRWAAFRPPAPVSVLVAMAQIVSRQGADRPCGCGHGFMILRGGGPRKWSAVVSGGPEHCRRCGGWTPAGRWRCRRWCRAWTTWREGEPEQRSKTRRLQRV